MNAHRCGIFPVNSLTRGYLPWLKKFFSHGAYRNVAATPFPNETRVLEQLILLDLAIRKHLIIRSSLI